MRIIAGRFRATRLRVASAEGLRPTGDRQRETLFSVLGDRCDGANVLDLFAGTGALGLEALSRGAAHATFVERDRRVAAVLRDNVARCDAEARAEVVVSDWRAPLRRWQRDGRKFDLVFIDPPWGAVDAAACLDALVQAELLDEDGVAVLEHDRRERPEPELAEVVRVLEVGGTHLSLCRRRDRSVPAEDPC